MSLLFIRVEKIVVSSTTTKIKQKIYSFNFGLVLYLVCLVNVYVQVKHVSNPNYSEGIE